MKKLLFLIPVLIMIGCAGGGTETIVEITPPLTRPPYVYKVPEWVEGDLEVGHINDSGIDLEKVAALIDSRSDFLHSILIFRHNKLVLEEYFKGQQMIMSSPITWNTKSVDFDRTTPHYLASVTKSFISAMIGMCIDRGWIENKQVKLSTFYPEYSHLFDQDERKKQITLEHVLSMRAGFSWDGPSTSEIMRVGDIPWVEFVISRPMDSNPGTLFNYSDGLSVILGDIVTRVSGKRVDLLAQELLFDKINIAKPFWDISRWDEVAGGWGLWMVPRDMVKFGDLFLKEGWHDGEYIISPEWVEYSKTRTATTSGMFYCYQWWARDYKLNGKTHPALVAAGAGGQHIFIVPTLDLVVVFTQGDYNYTGASPFDLMQTHIISACTE